MHYAKVEKSERLSALLEVLTRYSQISTLEIVKTTKCKVLNPGTAVSELRAQGYMVDCQRIGKIYFYQIIGVPPTDN